MISTVKGVVSSCLPLSFLCFSLWRSRVPAQARAPLAADERAPRRERICWCSTMRVVHIPNNFWVISPGRFVPLPSRCSDANVPCTWLNPERRSRHVSFSLSPSRGRRALRSWGAVPAGKCFSRPPLEAERSATALTRVPPHGAHGPQSAGGRRGARPARRAVAARPPHDMMCRGMMCNFRYRYVMNSCRDCRYVGRPVTFFVGRYGRGATCPPFT